MEPLRIGFVGTEAPHSFMFLETLRLIPDTVGRIALVEIIPGKGSGQLKKRVLRFLQQPHIKKLYHRIDKDSKNFGRIFVRFKHSRTME